MEKLRSPRDELQIAGRLIFLETLKILRDKIQAKTNLIQTSKAEDWISLNFLEIGMDFSIS